MSRISIVIPSYNAERFLESCLESVIGQSYEDWEAVVIDDASRDNTLAIANTIKGTDNRIVVISKESNEGLHLARLSGTEAATGDYIMYLDADDELFDTEVLSRLAAAIDERPVDILRFGLHAQAEDGVSESAANGFTDWSNADAGELTIEETRRLVFSATGEWQLPWHVTHRLFEASLAKRAFGSMVSSRLERAEDAYEYLVLSSLAKCELTRCDISGYLYHMGVGVTNAKSLSARSFEAENTALWKCAETAMAYAKESDLPDLIDCAYGLRVKLLESAGNDLNERVLSEERELAERSFVKTVGADNAACEFWRFVRDRAWRYLVNDNLPDQGDELYRLMHVAQRAFSQSADAKEIRRCSRIKKPAEQYLAELGKRRDIADRPRDIRIFAAAHRRVQSFDSSTLELIQVGARDSSERFWDMLHDDVGANISELNPYYCELTAQYWAWKNIDAEYYGFCHYRRYFDFSDERRPENDWGEIIDAFIDNESQARYELTDEGIQAAISGYDIVATEEKDVRLFPEGFADIRDHWNRAENLREEDLAIMMSILANHDPSYMDDIDRYLNGGKSRFCNMYIMRKDIFYDYCNWLFPLLEEYMSKCDFSNYSHEMLRTPGHLAERLFNIYLLHQERIGSGWRVKSVQCVHFLYPQLQILETSLSLAASATTRTIVPVVFAANDAYVPMLTTAIHSMLENGSRDSYYDITILSSGISYENQRIMRGFLLQHRLGEITFLEAQPLVQRFNLATSNSHITVETYYRFLIQEVLPHYDKVLYLDSDLVIEGDVSTLMDIDLGDNLIAAVRDVDYLGNLNMNVQRIEYTRRVLQMSDPYDYFQAGVLLLNTEAMRKAITSEEWCSLAQHDAFIYDDQDILNACCEGRVLFLESRWNVMHDCAGRVATVFAHAPAKVFDEYCQAREAEEVIHYAGVEKPWNTVACDRAERFWHYARHTPFYEKLIATLASSHTQLLELERQRMLEMVEPFVIGESNPIRIIIDPLMPHGSRRRELVRLIVKKVRRLG